jgi:predicted SAM-dependent methyltransferase
MQKKGYNFIDKLNTNIKFDVITIFEVIEHLSYKEIIELFVKIKKMLKKNGIIIISTPNPANLDNIEYFWGNMQHIRPYNKYAIINFFSDEYNLIKYDYFWRVINPIKILRNLILGFVPFTNHLFVFKRKKN